MSRPHESRPAPPYGHEAAYAAHGDAVPTDVPTDVPTHVPTDMPAHHGPPPPAQPSGHPYPGRPDGAYLTTAPRPYAPRNDLAVWSLVLGLLGVMGCLFLTGIPAVIVGGNARRAAAAGLADNEGMATAGIVLGWVATGLGVLVGLALLLAVILPLLVLGLTVPFFATAP